MSDEERELAFANIQKAARAFRYVADKSWQDLGRRPIPRTRAKTDGAEWPYNATPPCAHAACRFRPNPLRGRGRRRLAIEFTARRFPEGVGSGSVGNRSSGLPRRTCYCRSTPIAPSCFARSRRRSIATVPSPAVMASTVLPFKIWRVAEFASHCALSPRPG